MAHTKFDYEYHPIESPDGNSTGQPKSEKLRRVKKHSLYFVILLILTSYILINIVLPDSSIWSFYNERAGDNVEVIYPSTPFIEYLPYNAPNSSSPMACSIPKLKPFDQTIIHLVIQPDPVRCEDDFPLIFQTYPNSSIEPLASDITKAGYVSCCFTVIMRHEHGDSGYSESSKCVPISTTEVTKITQHDMEFIGIYCRNKSMDDSTTTTTTELSTLPTSTTEPSTTISATSQTTTSASSLKTDLTFTSTTEASISTTEAPKPTTEAPTSTTEAPKSTTEAPTSTTEAPTSTTEAPTSTTEAPTSTTEALKSTTEAPKSTTAEPISTTDLPSITTPHSRRKRSANDASRKIVDIFPLVHLKPNVEKRVSEFYEKLGTRQNEPSSNKFGSSSQPQSDKLNVVIFGIDAVSHMNFLRVMPKSYSFLMGNLSAVEMHAFNKIGDNTYPNLAAVLTSLNLTEMEKCQHEDAFDKCPFVWKQFAEKGFRTAYCEDSTWMGIFNYLKKGFNSSPTDYYLRPFGEAADKLIGTHKKLNARLCQGPRLGFQILLEYAKRLAYTMGHDKRYFHLTWATSLTHDYLNDGKLGDEHLLSTLQWFKEEGYLNHTAFILMSDHGIRWGEIRDYLQGELEERLPFLYFVLPDWFKEKFPMAHANLVDNNYRLTTPYDLHQTLLDLLDLERIEDKWIKARSSDLEIVTNNESIPIGISQFLPIPLSRTCEMAAIEEHYCTCYKSQPVPIDHPVVKQVANYIVFSINKKISEETGCAYLTLKTVRRAMALSTDPKADVKDSRKWNEFQISVETQPGGGVFESSVGKDRKGFWKVSGTISRTNLYGNQSHCISSKELKLYCYCVDLLKNSTSTSVT